MNFLTTFLNWSGEHPCLAVIFACCTMTASIAITEQVFLGVAAIIRAFRKDQP